MKGKKLFGASLLLLLIAGLHVPPSQFTLQQAVANLDGATTNLDSVFFILELNFSNNFKIVLVVNAKVTWKIANVELAENVPLFYQGKGIWNTSRFEVPSNLLSSALGAALFTGTTESTFVITFNYYLTRTFTIETTFK